MKRSLLLLRVAALGLLVFQITSCQKILDHWPGHGHGGGDSTVKYRIKSVTYFAGDVDTTSLREATFEYGTDNVLDSVVATDDNPNITESLYFTYNATGALVAYAKFHRDLSEPTARYTVEHWYGIGSGNRILTDTMAHSGFATGFGDKSNLEYDDQSRVIKDVHQSAADGNIFPVDTLTFSYDASGNRGFVDRGNGGITSTGGGVTDSTVYDNKVAYRSTNPIFQLIDRDWSKNNSTYATSYNSAGLPLGFAKGSQENFLDLGEPRVIEWEQVP